MNVAFFAFALLMGLLNLSHRGWSWGSVLATILNETYLKWGGELSLNQDLDHILYLSGRNESGAN